MASSYFISIPKADLQLKKITDFTTGIFIDNSGSTGSVLTSTKNDILKAELSICQAAQFDHIILWNTSAEMCTNIQSARPTGGTDPSTIFQNESTKKAFHTSDVVVFVTDGEIDNGSVTRFATYTKDNLNKALVICVIVNNKNRNPSQINVSVVAPLMIASNVLCLFYDGEIFYILSSKGYVSQFYQPSNDLTDYKNLNTLNLNELFHNIEIYENLKIPNGCIPVRDDEHEIIAIDFNKLLKIQDVNLISKLTEEDWKTLIQYGKIGNKLDELRTFVSHMKNQAIQIDKDLCKSRFKFPYGQQRDEIVVQIVALKLNVNEHAEQLQQLRHQLHEISDRAKIEEIEFLKYVNINLHQSRQYWNKIQSLIQEQETGSYSINDFTFASNRANRAKAVTNTDDENADAINILDHTDVPLFECAICMEQGPFVLWLKEPANLEDTTNDFIINFPLEGNERLAACLVSNPVCGNCAKSYINASINNRNQLITLYREPCNGFVPLNWSTELNRKFVESALYRILTGNKILPHVKMLLLAVIDNYQSNWLSQEIKDYFIKQMVENILTTNSFSEEGTRMVFINAIKEVIQQENQLFRQPFNAVCRILNFNVHFHQLDSEIIQTLLRKRFALMCIESQCARSKYGPEHLAGVKQELYDLLFDTLCGIPLQNSLKQIDIDHEKVKEFLNKFYDTAMKSMDRLAANIGSDRATIVPKEVVSFILYLLTTVQVHDRPMKLYTDFALNNRSFRDNMQIEWAQFERQVNANVFGNYHEEHLLFISGYAINLGRFSCQSKLFFHNEPLWDQSMENQRHNVTTLMNRIKTSLDRKLREHYGSAVPSTTSSHFLLHRTVADVLETNYTNENDISEQMIMDCMVHIGRTAGRKGNIYADYAFPFVVLTIEDYLKFRRKTKNMLVIDDENLSRSYEYKVRVELIASGMEYDAVTNEVLFESAKLRTPNVIQIQSNTIDFNDLKRRVQKLYAASKTSVKDEKSNSTCLNIEIKDFIEFGYKLDADALLPIWAKEQQDIVSAIVVDKDEIVQPIKYVAGLDISFVKTNDKAVASMVIFDYQTLNIVAKISVNCNMKIPYIATFLAFREAPVFLKLIDIQKEHCPHLTPQVILMDGNGVWHPRRAGIASHFGVLSNIPCFGISKNVLYADGITRERIEELLNEKAPLEDQYVEVIGDSGNVLGLAYNVTGFVKNAVYISAGHKITLATACDIFKAVTKYRNCEPIRQADLLSREMVAKIA